MEYRKITAQAVWAGRSRKKVAMCLSKLPNSCITNMAAGILDKKLDHKEVVEAASSVKDGFIKLLELSIQLFAE